jgi:hypothetical protein
LPVHIAVIAITIRIKYYSSAGRSICFWIFNNDCSRVIRDAPVIWIVKIVPGIIVVPGIVPAVIISVRAICKSVIKIIIIQCRPAITILYSHSQETIFIIIIRATIIPVILFLYPYIFFLWAGGRIVYIIRCLTGFVSGGATAESGCCQCQKKNGWFHGKRFYQFKVEVTTFVRL